jgi:hypothetical protein
MLLRISLDEVHEHLPDCSASREAARSQPSTRASNTLRSLILPIPSGRDQGRLELKRHQFVTGEPRAASLKHQSPRYPQLFERQGL